jgi:hypothetical protein
MDRILGKRRKKSQKKKVINKKRTPGAQVSDYQ